MQVSIKTPEEIEKMRVAGRLAAEVLEMLDEHVKPGISTEELNSIAHDYIVNKQQLFRRRSTTRVSRNPSVRRSTMLFATASRPKRKS
jgi:methionine aminopeptidase